MWNYSEKVMDHFRNPRNVGEVIEPNAVGEIGNIVCGDALKLSLKIDPETEIITEAKFQTFGCGSAIASSSALTELIKGKTLAEALKITNDDIAKFLGGLPEEKMHCSVMGMEALEAAIKNYRGVQKEKEEVVCKCFNVTAKKIIQVIEMNNLTTVEQVTNYTKAGGGCGKCKPSVEKILNQIQKRKKEKKETCSKKMTNLQKISLIQETLEREIRPSLQADGGDIELIDIDRDTVYGGFSEKTYLRVKA